MPHHTTLSELDWNEVANVLTHLLGVIGGVVGFTLFTRKLRKRQRRPQLRAACLIFTVTLCLMYAASTCYHAVPPELKYQALVFDQLAVLLAIGGTASAYSLLAKPAGQQFLHAKIWLCVIAGMLAQIELRLSAQLFALGCVLLGGICMVLVSRGPIPGYHWLLLGGLVYLLGLPFLASVQVPFSHACWHLCVLLGSICHYMALRCAAPRRKSPEVEAREVFAPRESSPAAPV